MGLQNSKNQYSFNDHYYIVQDSFPSDNYYRLQSKLTDELFVGREIHSLDQDDQYQIQCVIDQKLKNPSPFVSKLVNAQKNIEHGYCQTNSKFYLLYKQIPKLLAHEIQQRKAKKQPFTPQEVATVIIRIAKGLKYVYEIGHYHGNVSQSTISWPISNQQSIQLIDDWALRSQHRSLSKIDKNYPDFGQGRSNEHSHDLNSLGVVAKKMMEISPQMERDNSPLMQSIKHKIFVLLSENQFDRFQVYNLFSNQDRQLQSKVVAIPILQPIPHNNTTQQSNLITQNKLTSAQAADVNTHNYQQTTKNTTATTISQLPPIHVNQQNTIINGYRAQTNRVSSNINMMISNVDRFRSQSQIQKSVPTVVSNSNSNSNINFNNFNNSAFNSNVNMNMSGYSNNFSTVGGNTKLGLKQNVSTFGNHGVGSKNVNVNFGTSGATNYSNFTSIRPSLNLDNKFGSSVSGFSNFSTMPLSNGLKFNTQPSYNITTDTALKKQFEKIASNKLDSTTITSQHATTSELKNKFEQFSISKPSIPSWTSPPSTTVTPTSAFTLNEPVSLTNGNTPIANKYSGQLSNQQQIVSSLTNNYNFSPTFGSPGISSNGQYSSSLFSFQDSLSSGGAAGAAGGDSGLFTSPQFFNKVHGTQMNFNNIRIEDHEYKPKIQQSATLPNPATSTLTQGPTSASTPSAFQKLHQPQMTENEQLPAVTTSITSQYQQKTLTRNIGEHSYQNQRQPSEQISSNIVQNSYTNNNQNQATAANSNNHSAFNLYSGRNVSVIPELNQQSEAEDVDRQYVVEEYENGSRYEGEKVASMRDGHGKFYYKEGTYYDGNWKNNNMHGFGRLYYPNNKLAYQGQWFIDQFHGHGKVYNDQPNQIQGSFDYTNFDNIEQKWKFYEGTLVCDSKQGFGKLVLSNGEYYEGNFQGDRVHGQGKFVNMYGQTIKGVWSDSRLVKINQI